MKRTTFLTTAVVLGSFALLFLAVPAEAGPPVVRARVVAPPRFAGPVVTNVYRPSYYGHAPGWDWRRTYPYSAYNYNLYNPAPYYSYPVFVPTPVYYPVPSVTYIAP